MRQPTATLEEFLRVFLSLSSRSSHLESGTLFLRVLASGSHCSGCLGVAFVYESWILREMTFSSWVQCLVQQWIHVLRQYSGGFGRMYTFSTWWQTRFLERCFSIRFEWRSVPSRCFGCSFALCSSHLETLNFFLRVSRVELHDEDGFSAAQCGIFRPPLRS